MNHAPPKFEKPSAMERVFNRVFGALVGLGIGLKHNYLLQVRGRKSGRVYSTPVDVLVYGEKLYLVAPRGTTQWVRNVRANDRVTLKRGRTSEEFHARAIPDGDKPPLLKAYLERFKTTVQRYFAVPAQSPVEAFAPLAQHYPVFELTRTA